MYHPRRGERGPGGSRYECAGSVMWMDVKSSAPAPAAARQVQQCGDPSPDDHSSTPGHQEGGSSGAYSGVANAGGHRAHRTLIPSSRCLPHESGAHLAISLSVLSGAGVPLHTRSDDHFDTPLPDRLVTSVTNLRHKSRVRPVLSPERAVHRGHQLPDPGNTAVQELTGESIIHRVPARTLT